MINEKNFKKFTKEQRSSFSYWFYHVLAFNLVAKELHCWKLKYLFHDFEKPWLKHQPDVDFFRGKIMCKKCGQKYWHQVYGKNISYWKNCNYKREDICIRGQINHNNLLKIFINTNETHK